MNSGSMAKTSTPARTPSDPQRSSSGSVPVLNNKMTPSTNGANGPSPRSMADISFTQSPEVQSFHSPVNSEGVDSLSGLFSPSILESARRSASLDYMGNSQNSAPASRMKKESTDSSRGYSQSMNFNPGSTGSPSVSSMSHGGVNSSCGTTPEPSHDYSPNRKQSEGATSTFNDTQNQGIQGTAYLLMVVIIDRDYVLFQIMATHNVLTPAPRPHFFPLHNNFPYQCLYLPSHRLHLPRRPK